MWHHKELFHFSIIALHRTESIYYLTTIYRNVSKIYESKKLGIATDWLAKNQKFMMQYNLQYFTFSYFIHNFNIKNYKQLNKTMTAIFITIKYIIILDTSL